MRPDVRVAIHAALGDRHRLAMVDELMLSDRTFQELADVAGLSGNLAAHHLAVLESAGLIDRHVSEGDRRRRYISLRRDRLQGLMNVAATEPRFVVFVCTHNSARSQFAAAIWQRRTGIDADSAGTDPADRVHPGAIAAAAEYGLDLRGARPKDWQSISRPADLVVSVCDRARESGLRYTAPSLHWSIPDPVSVDRPEAFRAAFSTIATRIEHLARATETGDTRRADRARSKEGAT